MNVSCNCSFYLRLYILSGAVDLTEGPHLTSEPFSTRIEVCACWKKLRFEPLLGWPEKGATPTRRPVERGNACQGGPVCHASAPRQDVADGLWDLTGKGGDFNSSRSWCPGGGGKEASSWASSRMTWKRSHAHPAAHWKRERLPGLASVPRGSAEEGRRPRALGFNRKRRPFSTQIEGAREKKQPATVDAQSVCPRRSKLFSGEKRRPFSSQIEATGRRGRTVGVSKKK